MTTNELLIKFRGIMKDYQATEIGYSDRDQLQFWRKDLVHIYAALADRSSTIHSEKIRQERRKDIVRAEEFQRIEDECKASEGKNKSATAITNEIGATEAYKTWSEAFSVSYGRWQQFTDLQDSVKLTIDSISSHLRGIQTTDYLDPK